MTKLTRRVAPRALIWGSCVTRDLFELSQTSAWELECYLARQSLISAYSGDVGLRVDPQNVSSPFQLRCFDGDYSGNALQVIRERRPFFDLLVVDLVDERGGVLAFADGPASPGGFVTNNWELAHLGLKQDLPPYQTIALGSCEHRYLWASAADFFLAQLSDLDLLHSTVVVAPAFAERASDGPLEKKTLRQARMLTRKFKWYIRYLERNGLTIVKTLTSEVATAHHHRWGPAPFHYDAESAALLAARLMRSANEMIAALAHGDGASGDAGLR